MISQKRTTMADGQGPPEKRRKTDQMHLVADDLWGDDDDDIIFSQMKLEHTEPQESLQTNALKEQNNNGKSARSSGPDDTHAGKPCVNSNVLQNSNTIQETKSLSVHVKSQGYHTMPQTVQTKSQGYHTMPQTGSGSNFNSKHIVNSESQGLYFKSGPNPPQVKGDANTSGKGFGVSTYNNSKVFAVPSKSLPNTNKGKQTHGLDVNKQSPTAGTTANTAFNASVQKKITAVEEENNFLKTENQKLREFQYGKDGQIKVLRTKVAQLEAERSREKHEKMLHREQQHKVQSDKEKRLEKELEKIKSTLQFKDREIHEVQEQLKRLEKQNRSNSGERSPCRSTAFPSPARSPRVKHRLHSPHGKGEPASPSSPTRASGDFPTKRSFLEVSPKMKKPATVNYNKMVEKNEEESEMITTSKTSTSKVAEEKIKPRMRLNVDPVKGNITGPQLVRRLLDGESSSRSHGNHVLSTQGIIGLFHNGLLAVDTNHSKAEQEASALNITKSICSRSTKKNLSASEGNPTDMSEKFGAKPENLFRTRQALSSLLDSTGWTTTLPSKDMNISCCSSKHAILMLPMIENYLQIYIDVMQGLNSSTNSQLSTDRNPGESPVDSVTNSMKNVILQGASYLSVLEKQTLSALAVLDKLIEYCGAIKLVLAADKDEFELSKESSKPEHGGGGDDNRQSTSNNMDVINDANRDKALLLLDLDNTTLKIAKNCDIFMKLMKLANPLEFSNKVGNVNICQAALKSLTSIAENCTEQQLNKFVYMINQEYLVNCLKNLELQVSEQTALTSSTLMLLTVLVKSHHLMEQLCSQDGDCILLSVYHCCEVMADTAKQSQRLTLAHRLFDLLAAIVTKHKSGSTLLFESDCECSSQVIKCVTKSVFRELEIYEESKCPFLLAFLRKGLCMMHALSTNDRLFTRHHEKECKHQFIQCVCGFDRLLKNIPDVDEAEMTLVYELWDFDQEVDTDEDLSIETMDDLNRTGTSMNRPGTSMIRPGTSMNRPGTSKECYVSG